MKLEEAVARLVAGLQRPFELTILSATSVEYRIAQRCLICEIELAIITTCARDHEVDEPWLHRELFALYDGHRCRIAVANADAARRQELFERTERESLRMTERAMALASDPEMAARADREATVLLTWAADLAKLV